MPTCPTLQPLTAAIDAALPLAVIAVLALALALFLAVAGFRQLIDQLRAISDQLQHLGDHLNRAGASPPALNPLANPAAPPSPPVPPPTVHELKAQLDAARQVGDTETVLALHDQLVPRLEPHESAALDKLLLPWFLDLLMRRMRSGTVRGDVALLAARIADRFPTTREGASLRASLPTLRRSAGLCAECAEPYNGDEDACPGCTNRKADAGPSTLPISGPWPEDEPLEADPSPMSPRLDS